MGARGLALGQAATALPGYNWALFANPALMNNEETALGFYGLRNYGFAELTDMSAFGSYPAAFGTAGLGFHRYGNQLFSETRLRLAYKNEWELLHFGFAVNYNHIAFGGDYGSSGAPGLDLGLAAELASGLWLGARTVNVNQPRYPGIDEDLPRELAIGFSYGLNEKVLFSMDLVKDVRFPVSYRGGIEIIVVENLTGRIGVSTEPRTYAFGFGYGKAGWRVNVAVQKHYVLGLSPGMDMVMFFERDHE